MIDNITLTKSQKQKDYYIKNKEHILERQKAYNLKNKDKIKEKCLNDPDYKEKRANTMKKYYQNLKENNPKKYELYKAQSRERSRLYRIKKKKELMVNKPNETNIIEEPKPKKLQKKQLTDEEKKIRQKEYKKKYLEKIKNDPEKYELFKEKRKIRMKRFLEKKKLNSSE